MSGLLQLEDVANRVPDEDVDMFRTRIADLLDRKSKGFPGAQPVSFAKRHIGELQRTDYYLCEKTDGIRCLLYLTFFAEPTGPKEACFLIDRKNDYYYIQNEHFHFPLPNAPPDSFHTETLLDGELVLDSYPDGTSVKRYLVFDCLAVDGNAILNRTLDKRLGRFMANVYEPYQNLLRTFPEEKDEQPFEVSPKKMEKPYGVEMMFKDVLPKLPHGNDGLVFTCRTSEYTIGTDQKIIKWKPPAENTIDFRLQLGRFPLLGGGAYVNGEAGDGEVDYDATPEFDLMVHHGNGRYTKFAALHVTEDEWKSMMGMGQMLDGRIIECYKDGQQRWRFKREKDGTPRFRDDKTDANHISTVDSVLESIEDAVSEDDLLAASGKIKAAWREREHEEAERRKLAEKEEGERRRRAEEERRKMSQKA